MNSPVKKIYHRAPALQFNSELTSTDIDGIVHDTVAGTVFATDPKEPQVNHHRTVFELEERLADPAFAERVQQAVMDLARAEADALIREWKERVDSGEVTLEVHLVATAKRTGYTTMIVNPKDSYTSLDDALAAGKKWLGTKTVRAKDSLHVIGAKGVITGFRIVVKSPEGEELTSIDPVFAGLVTLK